MYITQSVLYNLMKNVSAIYLETNNVYARYLAVRAPIYKCRSCYKISYKCKNNENICTKFAFSIKMFNINCISK